MARTRPGSDFCALSARRLCHRHLGPAAADDDAAEGGAEEEEAEAASCCLDGAPAMSAFLVEEAAPEPERRVTVRSVLKYSLSWVITPSGPTVQACTQ